jgi:hypothetical protein
LGKESFQGRNGCGIFILCDARLTGRDGNW